MKVLIGVCLLVAFASAMVQYDGYQVLRIVPQTQETLEFVELLHRHFENKVAFWKTPRMLGHPVDIMTPPHTQSELESVLQNNNIEYSVHVDDVQRLIDGQFTQRGNKFERRDVDSFDYERYHTYEEIMQWATDIATKYSDIVEEIVVGKSFEGRDIKILKIGSKVSGKPVVYIQGGIHAREWVSPATMLYTVKELVSNYGTDDDITAMLNGFDWYIVPVLNPDGYSYTWTNDRLWRKNRNNDNRLCVGVDLNRNYDYEWDGVGSSSNPCDETYHGEKALSEPELIAVTDFLLNLKNTQPVHVHMDFHCYGQYWIYPWGYSLLVRMPPEEPDMLKVATLATNALKAEYGTEYTVGGSARTMYPAAGASEDWGYGRLGAKYTYVVELRDEGRFGFLLPEIQILPTGIETFAGIKELGRNIVAEYIV